MAQVVQPRTVAVEPTDGEAALLDFLGRELDDDWTVYVQPFLNGDEPDLVALNPRAGVIVFEVKDYAEGAYSAEEGVWEVHDARGHIASRHPSTRSSDTGRTSSGFTVRKSASR